MMMEKILNCMSLYVVQLLCGTEREGLVFCFLFFLETWRACLWIERSITWFCCMHDPTALMPYQTLLVLAPRQSWKKKYLTFLCGLKLTNYMCLRWCNFRFSWNAILDSSSRIHSLNQWKLAWFPTHFTSHTENIYV